MTEKASVAIASNESFAGWTKTFAGPRLCAAIVDRITFGGTIIETGTDSYRLTHSRARADDHDQQTVQAREAAMTPTTSSTTPWPSSPGAVGSGSATTSPPSP